jgi:hypothetical protein
MITHKHIVQVHPVENGEVNLSKVEEEVKFVTKEDADYYIQWYDINDYEIKAVYLGRVNDTTGELE